MRHVELANRVMEMILNGNEEVLSILREQYRNADIVSVENEEVGFYINYRVNKAVMVTDGYNGTFQIGDVDGTVDNIDGAVGFILYIKNGYLNMLEGYSNIIDKWPEEDYEIKLKYDMEQRDYESLRQKWIKRS